MRSVESETASPETSQSTMKTQTEPQNMVDRGNNTLEMSNSEIQQQLADLGVELENRASKKLKYKRLYQQEREKQDYMKQHYHEQLEDKDATIQQLREKLREMEDTQAQYVARMEKAQQSVKDSVSPQPAPRTAKTPICPDPAIANQAATPGYGNTAAAGAILKQVNNMANRTGGKDKETKSEEVKNTDALNDAIRTFDPLADASKQDGAEECVSVAPRITRPPKPTVKAEAAPKTHLATRELKPGDGSTILVDDCEDQRGSTFQMDEPGAERMDRHATPNDEEFEKFYDAEPVVDTPPVNTATQIPSTQPSCPVCKLVFPMYTKVEIITEHVETHFASMSLVDVHVPEATPPPRDKKCIMCDEKFPEGASHQKEYEDHVSSHLI